MQFSPEGFPLADSFGNNLVRRYRPGDRLGGHDKFDNGGKCIMMNLTRKGGKEQEAFLFELDPGLGTRKQTCAVETWEISDMV